MAKFCCTVSASLKCNFCGKKPMAPARQASAAAPCKPVTSWPATCSVPADGATKAATKASQVDLPLPDGPLSKSAAP